MRDIELPNPAIGTRGFHLRRAAARIISALEIEGVHFTGGKHPAARDVQAFFDSCSAGCDRLIKA